jgi:regulator of protease activity HflC (stomatin/prohibitin superfamily)
MIREREFDALAGLPMLLGLLVVLVLSVYELIAGARGESAPTVVGSIVAIAVTAVLFGGLFVVNPNEAKVLQLFGRYIGTVKQPGLRWANPFYTKKRISQRVRNFESPHLKVNDLDGNPIEIAAVVVWKVTDTAEAVFEVDDYNNYMKVQTEAALRNLATSYPYDAHDDAHMSLRGHTVAVADHLKKEIQERLTRAGVEAMEARISHLAYAPEIAHAMLQRQQAGAIIAARQRIVEGAVGMVEMALELLSRRDIVNLDNERKAAMVSNLLVVLCGEKNPRSRSSTPERSISRDPWRTANRSCFGSTRRYSTPFSAGRTTTCAA